MALLPPQPKRYVRWLLLLVLVLAAGASFRVGEQWWQAPPSAPDSAGNGPDVVVGTASTPAQPATHRAPLADTAQPAPERDPTLQAPPRPQNASGPGGDAFAPVSWLPPPPKAAPPAPPPPPPAPAAPTAPPLPFTFVGLLEQGLGVTQPKAFLARGESLLVVAAGDTLEGTYSVDSITPQQITLTYLPLKTRQILTVSGAPR